jgi:hypothetical protein
MNAEETLEWKQPVTEHKNFERINAKRNKISEPYKMSYLEDEGEDKDKGFFQISFSLYRIAESAACTTNCNSEFRRVITPAVFIYLFSTKKKQV